jgi:hypothetical protein
MPAARTLGYHDTLRPQYAPPTGIMGALLAPGEQLAYVASISPAIYWQPVVLLVVAFVSGLWSLTLAFYFLAVAAILFLLCWTTQQYLLLGCSDRRIVCRHGILFADVLSVRYGSVESIEIITSPIGALLGYSNVLISGTGRLRFMVPYVADAFAFREAVMEQMEQPTAAR